MEDENYGEVESRGNSNNHEIPNLLKRTWVLIKWRTALQERKIREID